MADFTLKQHDTWPPIEATLSDQHGPLDLTGATVKLILKTAGGSPTTVIGACTLVSPSSGIVEYVWVVGDTATVNTYQGEFEITWPDSTVSTVPNDSYFAVAVIADLG